MFYVIILTEKKVSFHDCCMKVARNLVYSNIEERDDSESESELLEPRSRVS